MALIKRYRREIALLAKNSKLDFTINISHSLTPILQKPLAISNLTFKTTDNTDAPSLLDASIKN